MRRIRPVVGAGFVGALAALAGLSGCGSSGSAASADGGGGGGGHGSGSTSRGGGGSSHEESSASGGHSTHGESSQRASESHARSSQESGESSTGTTSAGSRGTSSGTSSSTSSASSSTTRTSASSSTTSGASSATSSGSSGTTTSSSSSSSSSSSAPTADVVMFHNHLNRDGTFIDSALTETAAATFGIDATFAGTFSGTVYASPLYVQSGVGGKGTFYVATEADTVYALDETTGDVDWHVSLGTPAGSTGTCGNIGTGGNPLGITGTPAIDLATRLMVLDTVTADGPGQNTSAHTIQGLSIDTGDVVWTVDVNSLTFGTTTFNPQTQNQRGAVLILNGVAYVAYGGNWGDCGTYNGWVVGVPLSGPSGAGAQAWATTVNGAGIWGVGGPASDGTSVFVTTGNGIHDMSTYGESEGIFRLAPGPTFSGSTQDYFALYNWQTLDSEDVDLSGSGPLVIDAPALTPSALVMGQGKDGNLYLVDRANLGGIATMAQPANVGSLAVSSGQISNGGAWATVNGQTYVVVRPNGGGRGIGCPGGMSGDLVGVLLDPTAASKMRVVWCAESGGQGSPSISTTDGNENALVWVYAANESGGGGGAQELYAWDLVTGTQVLTGASGNDSGDNVRSFTTPIVVHGRVFVAGDGQLYAFKAQ